MKEPVTRTAPTSLGEEDDDAALQASLDEALTLLAAGERGQESDEFMTEMRALRTSTSIMRSIRAKSSF